MKQTKWIQMLSNLHMLGDHPKHHLSSSRAIKTNVSPILIKTPGAKLDLSVPTFVCLRPIMTTQLSRTVLLERKGDQEPNGKSYPKGQKTSLLKRPMSTRAAARAPLPLPFVPSPPSPPFVPILLILTQAPLPDGGFLIIADVGNSPPPPLVRSLRFISPLKKFGGNLGNFHN